MSDQNKGRIAIKFGSASTSSSATTSKSRAKPPSSLGKRPRPHALGGGSDSDASEDSGDDGRHRGRHEAITGFGEDGAETKRKRPREEKKEYVIARQPNRNWKDEVRSQRTSKNPLPDEARAQQDAVTAETEPASHDAPLKWGLTVKEKSSVLEDKMDVEQGDEETQPTKQDDADAPPTAPRTADEEAMDALLGKAPKQQKVISTSAPATEDDAYRRDVEASGAVSTLQDYEEMPVEEFGAALLRGMGWNGEARGPPVKQVKRRQNRLGLGAKELKEDEDLGGWNQNGKKKSRPRLNEYRREESKRKEGRGHEDSYKRERERERDRERDRRHGDRDRDRDRDYRDSDRDRRRDRDRDHDRHRDRHRESDRHHRR